MRFIVHIGMEKTGTTSIQRFLRRNSEMLVGHGYCTPTTLGERSHVALAVASVPNEPLIRLHRFWGLSSAVDVAAYKAEHERLLRAELAQISPGASVLLSCEQLSFVPRSAEDVARLGRWLRSFTDEIEVLVYLRRQDEMLVSLYSQRIKSGATDPLEVPDAAQAGPGSKYDYRALVDRWAAEFGAGHVQVRVFDRSSLAHGDVVRDYMHAVGLPDDAGWALPDERNPSLDVHGLEYLRLFNQYVPDRSRGPNPIRADLAGLVTLEASSGPRLALPGEAARAFVGRFAEGNATIAQEYLGRPDGSLFSDRYADGPPPAPLTVDRAVQISAALWTRKQKELERLRRRAQKGSDGSARDARQTQASRPLRARLLNWTRGRGVA